MIHAKLCCRSLTEQKNTQRKGWNRRANAQKNQTHMVFNLTQTLTSFFGGVTWSLVVFYGFYHMVNQIITT